MNWLQQIERRISVRRFEPIVEEATLARVRRLCQQAKTYNSSALKYLLFPGSQVRAKRVAAPWYIGVAAREDPESLFNLGYSCQRLVLQLTAQDLGTCWLGFFPNREALAAALDPEEGLTLRVLIAWGARVRDNTPEKRGRRKAPERIAFFSGDREPRYPWRTVLEAVRWAPSALNRQPWRLLFTPNAIHLYSRSCLLAGSYTPIDMGIALSHLELACEQLAVSGHAVQGEHPQRRGWQYWISYQLD